MAGKLMYPNLEEDKIYTHELSSNSLMSISFTYSSINDKKQQLLIDISKEIPMEVTELVYEEKVINGITYKVSYSLNSDHLFGFSYHQDVNGLTYIVSFRKGEGGVSEFNGQQVTYIKSSLSEEDIKYLVEHTNIQKMVLKTLESL